MGLDGKSPSPKGRGERAAHGSRGALDAETESIRSIKRHAPRPLFKVHLQWFFAWGYGFAQPTKKGSRWTPQTADKPRHFGGVLFYVLSV
ncbi:MAG: hypothetical protein CFE27_04390 [Alphaproteobacteria bacterium PA1]|nr:MAG: hypothetical protein CFE27_04390 [Alphaproteobacteria bacterium PA1]